jgi:hypothetical protein
MLQVRCNRFSADFGNVEKKDTALGVAVRRDPGDLAPLLPDWRGGISRSALLVDRVADRFGNSRIETVRKQQDTSGGQGTKKKRAPR